MDLNQVTVPCADFDASIAFYRGLGLRLIVGDPLNCARFECPVGHATFSVHRALHLPETSSIVVYFEVDNVDTTVQQFVAGGYHFEDRPRDQSWLWREAYVRDPAGNRICLYQAGQNRRNPPWRLTDSC